MKAKHAYVINYPGGQVEVLADTLRRCFEEGDEWLILENDGDEVFRNRIRYLIGWSRRIEKRDFA